MHNVIRPCIEAYRSRMMSCGISFHIFFKRASNSTKLQLYALRNPRYAQSVTNLKIVDARKRWKWVGGILVKPLLRESEHCLVKKWLMGGLPCVAAYVTEEYHERASELSLCFGLILWVSVCRMRCHPIPSHQLWDRCTAAQRRRN
ncbi:hypothetical protein TNCV_582411 [Trichonephila clavipes]|nr:hypothetical protein TNCV_582411 [Trichonephila clavipes]